MSSQNRIEKKLTPAVILGGEAGIKLIPEGKTEVALFRAMGIARGTFVKSAPTGELTGLEGDFIGLRVVEKKDNDGNLIPAQPVASTVLWLPEVAQNRLVQGVLGSDGMGIEFAVELGIKRDPNPRNARGYQWYCEVLQAPAPTSVMAQLLARFDPQAKALPPATPAEPAPAEPAEPVKVTPHRKR